MPELTDRELDTWIAERVMGWTPYPIAVEISFRPSTDRNAAAQVLERIAELGLVHEFANELERLTNPGVVIWHGAIATPRQLMLAAKAAFEERATLEGGEKTNANV